MNIMSHGHGSRHPVHPATLAPWTRLITHHRVAPPPHISLLPQSQQAAYAHAAHTHLSLAQCTSDTVSSKVRAPGRIRASAVDPTAPPGHPHRPRHNTCGASINPQGSQIQMETTRSMSARFPKLLLACVAALLAATNATPTHTTPACPHAGLHDMYVTPSARLGFMLDCT